MELELKEYRGKEREHHYKRERGDDKPRGQPSYFNQIKQKDDSWVLLQQNRQN
jgi:hypothetical protein